MEENTKIEIWETFKDKFKEEGINCPDELVFQREFPTEKELVNNHSILRKIGKCGKSIIWLIKKGFQLGGAIVIIAALPGAIEQISTRYPNAFEVVSNIGQAIKLYNNKPTELASVDGAQEQYQGQYVAFNDKWPDNEKNFLQDIKFLNTEGIISDNTILAPATGLDPLVIIQSEISVAPSDLT